MHKAPMPTVARRPWGFTRFISKQGFHGVYLVSTEIGCPIKVGITNDPVGRLSELQVGNFNQLQVHRFWWLPGRRISARIERGFKDHFKHHNVRGEWFDTPLNDAERFIEDTIRDIGSWAIKQVHMIDLMDGQQRRRFMLPAEAPSPLSGLISPSEQGYRDGNVILPKNRTRRC